MLLKFIVPGKPFGKQRPRVNTRTRHTYTPERTENYENLIRMAFLKEYPNHIPVEGRVRITVVAAFPIPVSWSKKKREAAERQEISPGKPDIDNILKIVQDALNKVAYKDDSQIYSVQILKCYTAVMPMVSVEMLIGDDNYEQC